MAMLNFPLDIVADIIDVLADEKDWENVKTISRVSSFCHAQCRKRMFATITIGEGTEQWDNDREAFPMPSIYKFIALTKDHPQVTPYIRHLCLINPMDELDHAGLPAVLPMLVNIMSLEIHFLREQEKWSFLLSRSLEALSEIPSLGRLSLHGVNKFPLKTLASLYQLQHLELDHVDLLEEPGFQAQLPPLRLQSLVLMDFDEYDYDPRISSLKMKRQDGKFLIDFSAMKALHFSPFINQTSLEQASDLIRSHNIQSLEELSLGIEFLDDKITDADDHAQQLQDCILPQHQCLKKLTFFCRYGDQICVRDPYSTLCAVLEKLEPDNVLTSLEITIYVHEYYQDAKAESEQWQSLCSVLVKPGWQQLSSVCVKVWTEDEEFEEEMKKLPLYFEPLTRQAFKFTLDADPLHEAGI